MLLETQRREIIDHCLKMAAEDLTVGTSGNISVRVGDLVAITPSGVDYDALTPELISVIDLDGTVVEGERKPSTEVPMHLLVYRETDATAVIHTHPVYATVVSTLLDETPCIHYMLALHGGPVRVAPYAPFGTDELAEHIRTAMADRYAVLLQNHGATTWGDSLHSAFSRSLYLEWVCRVWVTARQIGDPRILTSGEMDVVMDKLGSYGK